MKRLLFFPRAILIAFSMSFFCSGCGVFSSREVTVVMNESSGQQREYYQNEIVNYDGLNLVTENFLQGNLLQDNFSDEPLLALQKLNEYYNVSGNPKYLLIAADLCRYLAAESSEETAIRYHLSNYYYSTHFSRLQRKKLRTNSDIPYDFSVSQSLQCYNDACNGIFSYLKKRNLLDASSVTLWDCENRKYIFDKPVYQLSIQRKAIADFSLCASYTVRHLMQFNREPGVGVPLVATVNARQDWYTSLKTPQGLTIPVTLLINPDYSDPKETRLRLFFVDTGKQEIARQTVEDSKQFAFPMALDFSTPLACFLDSLTQRNLLSQMLNPVDQEATDGLYMIEPYQPNKIPVVFIHGLMSSPETWVQMINSLKNDPTIRNRYQFWFFSYSTGAPVILSATKLRNALLAAEKEFCTTPETTANFNKMVLVGHSMGGLLTRLMVQKDSHYLFETIFKTPWDQIQKKLQPEDFKLLDSFAPYPLPFVHRVVFMAVPHRGANMAQSPIAQLGVNLIQLPKSLLSKETAITRITRTLDPEYSKIKMQNRFFTGIENLDPDNKFVLANGNSPLKEDLIYHCIIGNADIAGSPDGSDGVVPYWSSHLDGAASELVIKSDHSVHRKPAAIQELLRILLLHLSSCDSKK